MTIYLIYYTADECWEDEWFFSKADARRRLGHRTGVIHSFTNASVKPEKEET